MLLEAGEEISAREKSGFRDLVTEYDTAVQAFAVRELSAAWPEASFVCEESEDPAAPSGGPVFVIDPIDGTLNFVHHFRHSCTSIACLLDGEPAAGAVYDPYADEMFTAKKGAGAFRNGQRLQLRPQALAESIAIFGTSPYNDGLAGDTFSRVRDLYARCQDVRRSGSAALDLCWVAAGRAGLFFEASLSLWDYAAGALIVEEAGGRCGKLSGAPLTYEIGRKSSVRAGGIRQFQESGFLA